MKKNIIAKIGAAAVVLTMVTTSLVGGTFAKYTSTVSGDAQATIAIWDVKFEGNSSKFEKDTTIKLNGTGASNTVAPGDTGTLVLTVNPGNTQVDIEYKITLANASEEGTTYLKFYSDLDNKTEITEDDLTGVIAEGGGVSTKTVYWELVSNDNVNDDGIGLDNDMSGKTETYKVSITATQKVPSAVN